MDNLARDSNRNIAIFINDFEQKFADALTKLSQELGRPLRGIVLLDSEVKRLNIHDKDENNTFEQIVCDFSNDAELHAILTAMEDSLLLVTCCSERNQPYLQTVLPHVPYILGPTESSLTWSTHKGKMREMLGSYDNCLVPKTQVISDASAASINAVTSRLEFPVIVKPTGLASSMLVSKVQNETELVNVLTQSFAVINDIYTRDRGRGDPGIIVEEFIEGDMYSVDVYVNQAGKIWHLPMLRSKNAYTVGLKGFYTYQSDSFTTLDANDTEAGKAAAESAVHALGLRSCVAHIELFKTANGWKIIELGPRAGGQRQDIYKVAYGIDHAYNELRLKVGMEPIISDTPIAYCTTINFYAENEGIIDSIEGIEAAQNTASSYMLQVSAKPGDKAILSNNGGLILADGLMCNTNLEQLNIDASFVRSTLRFNVK